MPFDIKKIQKKGQETEQWLEKEFKNIRTGMATPSLLDPVMVESYGAHMPVSQVASISSDDPRSISVVPWDSSMIKPIEKAITMANLGVSVVVNDKGVRVIFPELTTDRRKDFVKIASTKLEEARVTLRKGRDEAIGDVQKMEKEGGMGKDDVFRAKGDIQKVVDATNKKLEEMFKKKEIDVMK
ncbi:MAG: ribosome recycling factor [Candidatus Paceibacterota bacterium]|jgi:ribosome recycling factor